MSILISQLVATICGLYTIQCIGFWENWSNTYSLSWEPTHSFPPQNLALPGPNASSVVITQHLPRKVFLLLPFLKAQSSVSFFLYSILMVLTYLSQSSKTSVNHSTFPFLWLSIFPLFHNQDSWTSWFCPLGIHIVCESELECLSVWNQFLNCIILAHSILFLSHGLIVIIIAPTSLLQYEYVQVQFLH